MRAVNAVSEPEKNEEHTSNRAMPTIEKNMLEIFILAKSLTYITQGKSVINYLLCAEG